MRTPSRTAADMSEGGCDARVRPARRRVRTLVTSRSMEVPKGPKTAKPAQNRPPVRPLSSWHGRGFQRQRKMAGARSRRPAPTLSGANYPGLKAKKNGSRNRKGSALSPDRPFRRLKSPSLFAMLRQCHDAGAQQIHQAETQKPLPRRLAEAGAIVLGRSA